MASGPRYAGASGSKSLGAKGMRAFTELYELHSGRHSTVWSARLVDDPDTVVVIKAYPKLRSKPRQLRSVTKELQLLRLFTRTRTEGVSHLVCSFEEDETVFLIFEACLHGDLYQLLARHKGQLTEEFVVEQVVVPLLRTLAHIHKLCLVHRDIKPENVFINSDGDMILGDFGLAAHTVHDTLTERVGTLDYMAPEVLAMPTLEEQAARPRTLQPYDEKVDVWAMGILVYELLCGSPPFEVDDPLETAHLIMQTSVNSFPESMSAECKSFIQLALKKDPKERPSAQALIFHPWVMECMEGDLPPPSCPESATKALKRIVHASWNITDLNNLLETVVPLPPGVDREAGASNRDCLTRLPSMNSHSRSLTTDDEKCFDYYSDGRPHCARERARSALSTHRSHHLRMRAHPTLPIHTLGVKSESPSWSRELVRCGRPTARTTTRETRERRESSRAVKRKEFYREQENSRRSLSPSSQDCRSRELALDSLFSTPDPRPSRAPPSSNPQKLKSEESSHGESSLSRPHNTEGHGERYYMEQEEPSKEVEGKKKKGKTPAEPSEESSWSREPSKTLLSPSSGTLLSARPSASGYSLSREPLPKLDELTVVSLAEASKEGGGGDQSPPQPPPKRGPPTQHRDPSRSSPHSSPQTKDHSLFSSEIQPLIEGFEALLNNTKRTQVGGTGGSTNKPQVAGFRGIPNLHSASPMDPPLTLSRPSTSCREAPSATKAMPSEGNLDSSSTKASSPTRVQPFPAPPTLATSAPCDADPCPSPSSSSPTALGKPQPVAESTQSNMTIKFPLHIHLHKASSFLPEATSFSPYSCSPAMIRCGGGSSGGTSYQIPGSGYSEGSTLDGILHRCISSPTRHHAIDEHTPAFSPFANQQAKASNPALSVETNAYRNTQGPFPMAKRPMESTKTDLSVETNAYRNTQGPFSSMAKQPTESTKTDLSVETNAYRNTQGPFSSMAKQPTESTRTDLSSQTSAGRNTEGQSPPGPDTTFTIQDPQSWYSFTASMESSTITGLSSSSGMPAPGMLKGSGCCPAADSAGFVIKPGLRDQARGPPATLANVLAFCLHGVVHHHGAVFILRHDGASHVKGSGCSSAVDSAGFVIKPGGIPSYIG
eukprot:gene3478-13538_t